MYFDPGRCWVLLSSGPAETIGGWKIVTNEISLGASGTVREIQLTTPQDNISRPKCKLLPHLFAGAG
jgi:hypothetical protein